MESTIFGTGHPESPKRDSPESRNRAEFPTLESQVMAKGGFSDTRQVTLH